MSTPTTLAEATSASRARRVSARQPAQSEPKSRVLDQIAEHVLLDGFRIVIDLDKSQGSYLYDSAHKRRLIDLYGFFGSNPVGFNHPYFHKPKFHRVFLRPEKKNTANPLFYSKAYPLFVNTFWRVMVLPPL